jgi:hypothetical protein
MKSSVGIAVGVGAFLAFVAVSGGAEARRAGRSPDVTAIRAPLGFEPNRGQAAAEVEFLARGRSYVLALTRGDAVLAVGGATVRMRAVGANPAPAVAPQAPLPGRVSYLIGRDATRWRTGIPTYARVLYRDVYPAIDLVYHGSQGELEYDFVVAPGADPATIRLAFDGVEGLALDGDGALRLTTPAGAVRLPKPTIYQERDGARQEVAGGYVVQGTMVAFWTAPYDRTRPLVIDPVISWSSYLGGTGSDGAGAIAVDAAGDVYVTGGTLGGSNHPTFPPSANDFPTTPGTVQPTMPACGPYPFLSCGDVFVAKLAGDGSGILWATYLGGADVDAGLGIAVDAAGQVYVTGSTESGRISDGSGDFPTTPAAFRPTRPFGGCGHGGCTDGFIAKLSPDGRTLVYASYLGGGNVGNSYAAAIAVDGAENAYVTGFFSAPSALTQYHFGAVASYSTGAFVMKFDPAGALVYSADFGSGAGNGIAVDAAGHAYITGLAAAGFPTVRALQPSPGGSADAFVAKVAPDGSALVYSTFLGGSAHDEGAGIVVDGSGQVYVAGSTGSADFPTTPGALTAGAVGGAFVTKLDASATALVYSAVIADGRATALAVDASGSAYVTGNAGPGFPTVDAVQDTAAGEGDAFVAKLSASGAALVYSTYLGGSGREFAGGIALGAAGTAYVAGETRSANFPAVQPFQAGLRGVSDAFVAVLVEASSPPPLPLAFEVRPTTVVLGSIAPGDTQTIETHVWASAAAGDILVDLEVYNASGVKVAQQVHGGQSFAAGQTRVYRWNLPLGAAFTAGTYTVKVGVFTGDWSHLYVWVNQGATFVVDPPVAVLSFTIGPATFSAIPVVPGRNASVGSWVTASRPVPLGALAVVVEVHDPSGQRVAERSHTPSFGSGLSLRQAFSLPWDVPATAPTGRYTVVVSVFNADRSLVYVESAQAGTFFVGSVVPPLPPPPPPPGPLAFAVGAALVTPNPVAAGGAVHVHVPVTPNHAASGILVDLGLYGPGGARVLQKVFGSESFATGEPRTFSWTIDPVSLAAGTYTVKAGVFTVNWGSLFTWVDQVGMVTVSGGTPLPPPPGPLTFTIGNAAVTPDPVSAGQTVRLDVPVTASAAASAILVDLELYNGAGTKVLQSVLTGQSFTAGQTRIFQWSIGPVSLPAGTYTVRAGIFNADWSTLYTWDSDAGTLTVR